jgi:hypothetical protein
VWCRNSQAAATTNKMMNELKEHEKNGEKVFLFSRT